MEPGHEGGMEPGQESGMEPEQVVQQQGMEQVGSGMESGQPAAAAVEEEETRTAGVNDLPSATATTATTPEKGQAPAETGHENEPMAEEEGKGADELPAVSMEISEVPEIAVEEEEKEKDEEEEEEEEREEGKRSEIESSTSEMEVRGTSIIIIITPLLEAPLAVSSN